MSAKGLVYRVMFLFAVLLPGPALAEPPTDGLLQYDYIASRPQAGGATGDAYGYELTVGYQLPADLIAFGEYEHLRHPFLPPATGYRDEADYEAGLKLAHPLNSTLLWVTALAYEEERDTAATGDSTERGYEFVQGLRIVVNPGLELVADLHHEKLGSASNSLVLGFIQGFGSRFAVEGLAEHSQSEGRFDNSYHLGLRVYY